MFGKTVAYTLFIGGAVGAFFMAGELFSRWASVEQPLKEEPFAFALSFICALLVGASLAVTIKRFLLDLEEMLKRA